MYNGRRPHSKVHYSLLQDRYPSQSLLPTCIVSGCQAQVSSNVGKIGRQNWITRYFNWGVIIHVVELHTYPW